MLSDCAAELVAQGWHVVLPSRRYAPLAIAPGAPTEGRALWVAADWSDPKGLADRAGRALGGKADLLVVWVRREQRGQVLATVAPLLTAGAPVVEVHGSATAGQAGPREPVLADHPTQQVVLGFVPEGRTTRRLNQEEISQGVVDAVRRALDGRPPATHQVGDVLPWSVRV
jgi:NAD(P)-dependent dehydrogenase (short-subunit alcohol dehydrogenase family)